MEKASGYDPSAGKVIIDEHLGHPGIKATTLDYAEINDEMIAMLDKPHPSYFLLLLGFLLAFGLGILSFAIQIDVGIGYSGISHPIAWGYYKFRFLDWNWSCRYSYFRGFLPDPCTVANCNLP